MTEMDAGRVLSVLLNKSDSVAVGVVGSPSDTQEITIDILETAETSRIVGQMVYLVLPHDKDKRVAVLGQISRVETKNRWHEDIAFRGIIKRQGSLPHLSDRADVRTATLTVQAAFAVDLDEHGEECCREDMLGTSPGTGVRVYLVRDAVLKSVLARYDNEIIYLGRVFGTEVKMPFTLRHFGRGAGGAGEAYHIGVFGKTGSGKSGLAAYMLLAYARHKKMGLLFIDPQGQFSTDRGLPFKLHKEMRKCGREVKSYRLATEVRLREDADAFAKMLDKIGFFEKIGIKSGDNRKYAVESFADILRRVVKEMGGLDSAPIGLMKAALEALVADNRRMEYIYATPNRRDQLAESIRELVANADEREEIRKKHFQPAHDLFLKKDSLGNERTGIWEIVSRIIGEKDNPPLIFLDISSGGSSFRDQDIEEIQAMLLKEIANALRVQGEEAYRQNNLLNCLVALDEAHRFVRAYTRGGDDSEMAELTKTFVDAVRTTRKYGLGYMFITQTIASLHKEIIGQLRSCAFGYGLTMGSEMAQLQDLVGDKEKLSLYSSFVDPQSAKQYPFMFTGPVSPLSFTGAPLFVQMFTDFADFTAANGELSHAMPPEPFGNSMDTARSLLPPAPVLPSVFGSKDAFQKAKSRDFD